MHSINTHIHVYIKTIMAYIWGICIFNNALCDGICWTLIARSMREEQKTLMIFIFSGFTFLSTGDHMVSKVVDFGFSNTLLEAWFGNDMKVDIEHLVNVIYVKSMSCSDFIWLLGHSVIFLHFGNLRKLVLCWIELFIVRKSHIHALNRLGVDIGSKKCNRTDGGN